MDDGLTSPLIGRIAGKGLADELHDRGYLVVDGIDRRAHYLKLPPGTDLAELPVHGVVEARPLSQEKSVDRHIAKVARDGLYKTSDHVAQLRQANDRDPQSTVDAHVRRLEALRRAGIVERIADGVWNVPPDLLQKARTHDTQRTTELVIELRSHLPIDQQVRAIGATWLDKQLVGDSSALVDQGFGAQVRDAMRDRVNFLITQGLAEWRGQRAVLATNLLATLRERELAAAGNTLEEETGQAYRAAQDGGRASGVYRRSIQLVSGRFAMLDNGTNFPLCHGGRWWSRDWGSKCLPLCAGLRRIGNGENSGESRFEFAARPRRFIPGLPQSLKYRRERPCPPRTERNAGMSQFNGDVLRSM